MTFPTARGTAGLLRGATAASTAPKHVCALQAGKVSLLLGTQSFGGAFSMYGAGSLTGRAWEYSA